MTNLSADRREFMRVGGIAVAASALASFAEAAWTPKAWSAVEKANVKIVEDCLMALEAGNVDAHVDFFADDAHVRYRAHTPAAPVNRDGVRTTMRNFTTPGAFRVKIFETVAQGPMVINTRVDRIAGARDAYYMGVFFVKDGKISEWSDYQVAPDRPVKSGDPF